MFTVPRGAAAGSLEARGSIPVYTTLVLLLDCSMNLVAGFEVGCGAERRDDSHIQQEK